MYTQFLSPPKPRLSSLRSLSLLLLAALISLTATAQTLNPATWVTNGTVNAIATNNTYTYIGGSFNYVGPNTGSGGKLTSGSASPDLSFPAVVGGDINTAAPDGSGGWYIGGSFTQVGGITRNRLAHILPDGSVDAGWNPNANSTVQTIAVSGADIYAGGDFTSIGGQTRNRIAKLNNTAGAAASAGFH